MHPSEALLAFAERRLSGPALLRSLAEYRGFLVASEPNPDGGTRPALRQMDDMATLAVFVDDRALDLGVVHYGPSTIQQALTGVDGAALFSGMPDHVERVVVNPGSGADVEIQGSDIGTIRRLARAVRVERALADPTDGAALRRYARTFDGFRLPLVQTPAGLVPMQLNDRHGAPHALVFTAQDCVDAFLATAPPEARSETILWMTMGGVELFTKLPELDVAGVLFNVSGPTPRAAFKIGICELVIAAGKSIAPPSRPAAEPPAQELSEEQRVLVTIQQVAGGARRADFAVTSFTTSAHRIFWISLDGTGIVRRGEVGHGDGEEIGRVKFEQVVSLARALRDADLINLQVPPGTPPPPPTVPPARIGVRSGEDRLFVEAPASQLELVPALADLLRRLHVLADEAAAAVGKSVETPQAPLPKPADRLARALEELASGRAPQVSVRAVFRPDEHRRSELCVAHSGEVVRREFLDAESSASQPVGNAPPDTLARLARVLLDAGVPSAEPPNEGSGPPEYPRIGLCIDLPGGEPFQLEMPHTRIGELAPLKAGIDAIYALARAARSSPSP